MWWPPYNIWWQCGGHHRLSGGHQILSCGHHIIISWPPGKKILAQVCLSGGDQIIWLFGGNVLPAHWPSTAKVHCSCGRERQVLVCCILLKNSCQIRHNYDDTARGVMFHMAKLLINIFKKDRKKIKNLWHPCCGPAQNSFVNHKKTSKFANYNEPLGSDSNGGVGCCHGCDAWRSTTPRGARHVPYGVTIN